MEDVSTRVLEKIKNISKVKIKPKNDMMYQDIYNCICQSTKNEDILSSMSNIQLGVQRSGKSQGNYFPFS